MIIMTTKWLKTIIVTVVFAVVLVPIAINYLCLTAFPAPLVGDGKLWLGFWGSYLGGIIAVLSTVYVLYRNHEMEYNRKEYEIQKEYFNSLCDDMGKLCSAIDTSLLSFYLKGMINMNNTKNILALSDINQSIICKYNGFCLKYAHWRGKEGEALINAYAMYSNIISKQISIIQEAANEKQTNHIPTELYKSIIDRACKELEICGDVRPELFSLAENWKKSEYRIVEEKRRKYEKG